MSAKDTILKEETVAFDQLTESSEKEHFEKILDFEVRTGRYIYEQKPRLCINYYVTQYKQNNRPFSQYMSDTYDDQKLLEYELSAKDTGSNRLKNYNIRRSEETATEFKKGKRRNLLFAIILLVILFILIARLGF